MLSLIISYNVTIDLTPLSQTRIYEEEIVLRGNDTL